MNSLWIVILVLAVVVVVLKFGLGASGTGAAAKAKIQQGARVVDVRTPAEYGAGHYEGATNIPLQELQGRLAELGDRQKPLVVYCASGMRSAQAAKLLVAAGFTDVTNAGSLKNLR